MRKNIDKNISKDLRSKCSPGVIAKYQKPFYHGKQSATEALKTSSKRAVQETAEVTGDLIVNKIADKITEVSLSSPQNSWEMNVRQKMHDLIEKHQKKDISPEKRQQISNDPRWK